MIFSKDYDRTLLMILIYDKKNRYDIARLVSSLDDDLINNIRNNLNKDDVLINKAIRNNDGATTMYRIRIMKGKLLFKVSKWVNEIEEKYEFVLVPFCDLDELDDIIYIGGYSSINSRLSLFFGNRIVSEYNCMQYELYENINSNLIIQMSGDRIKERVVYLEYIDMDVTKEDLCSKKNVNKLIRVRKGV